ncbi:AI-2E family transporter [Bauldia sp.]|uniref:AI-2E family transporter n=1 Tax=Bauldia sp. TaxID=2575872 RepID=UPI003BAC7F94
MADNRTEKREAGRFTVDRAIGAIVVGVLVFATFATLRPFFPAILWAVVLAVTAAPLHGRILDRMPAWPRLAAVLTTLFLALILVVPAIGLTRGVIAYTPEIIAWVESMSAQDAARAPESIGNIPWIGDFLSSNWEMIATEGRSYIAHFSADIESWLAWALQQVENVGLFMFEIALGVILAGVFLAKRARLSAFAQTFFGRVGGDFALRLVDRTVVTTRSTVRGVVGGAVAEAIVAAFAYFIAGVPAWLLLGALTFFAALIQIGTPLVWIPVAIWLLIQNELGWAIFIVAWGMIVVYGVENVSRPFLAGRAAELPGLLIFIGVLGGLVAWGLIGVFLGPVILAVAYELVQAWFDPSTGDDPDRRDGAADTST